jgi:hypothetical protein
VSHELVARFEERDQVHSTQVGSHKRPNIGGQACKHYFGFTRLHWAQCNEIFPYDSLSDWIRSQRTSTPVSSERETERSSGIDAVRVDPSAARQAQNSPDDNIEKEGAKDRFTDKLVIIKMSLPVEKEGL